MLGNPLGNSLGNPLGLARSGDTRKLMPDIVYFNIPGSGDFEIDPREYSFFRVFIVGGGGAGVGAATASNRAAGSGGGSAISDIYPVRGKLKISYEVGAGGTGPADRGQSSSANFLNVQMLATGGRFGGGTDSSRGVGSGGLLNFEGGLGQSGSGAQPGGGGGVSANGDDGGSPTVSTGGAPGCGSGADALGSLLKRNRGSDLVGFPSPDSKVGGEGGGGGGTSAAASSQYAGGVGIVRIELW